MDRRARGARVLLSSGFGLGDSDATRRGGADPEGEGKRKSAVVERQSERA